MTYKVLVIVFFSCFLNGYVCSRYIIPVGGIFEGPSENEELAFKVAIDMVNNHQRVPQYILKPLTARIEPDDVINAKKRLVIDVTWDKPYAALEKVCSILKEGAVSIFNLLSGDNSNAVQSLCDAKEIPVIQTMLDTEHEHGKECCSINLFPHVPILARAFADLVKQWNWNSFTIIYENQRSLPKITEMLKFYDRKFYSVVVRQLYSSGNGDYTDSLKALRKSGQTRFVLDCSIKNLNEIFKQAQHLGLMTREQSYIVINLDMHTVDLSLYQHSETNITGFRLVDPLNPDVIKFAEALQMKRRELGLEEETISSHIAAWKLETSAVLLVDAVMLFAEVLKEHGNFRPKALFCNSSDSWEHGSTVFNFMKTKILEGLTGTIEFDYRGFRTDFSLEIIELTEGGIIKVGSWSSRKGLKISRVHPLQQTYEGKSLENMTFTVMVAVNNPYTMLKETATQVTGNDQYEGFAIDLIRELALLEGFNYTFLRNEDDKNGAYNSITKKWNGLIGDVLDGKADLAIGDLTITRQREQYVDFTSPFMSLGIQILYKKPKKAPPGFFSFATPLGADVWLLIGITFFGMSAMFYIIARICPAEWCNPHPCLEQPRYLTNQYDIENCMWLILGNLMQEGADVAPRGASTRVLSSFWSFFILIMVTTYTANMAAFLTAEKDEWPFTNVKELVNRADKFKIEYGAVQNGATHKMFQESEDKLYKQIGAYMDSHPGLMVSWYEDGVDKVNDEDSNYAFFMESSSIKYETERKCNLTAVGQYLDEKYYGIAMRKNSSYRNRLSAAILKLTESGKIHELERKWWEHERGAGECVKLEVTAAPPLKYMHVFGMFTITFGGIILACGLVFVELALHIIKNFRKKHQRIEEFKKELKFYCKFEEMVKPAVKKKRSRAGRNKIEDSGES